MVELLGLALAALGVCGLAALATTCPTCPETPWPPPPSPATSAAGAVAADLLLQWVGAAAIARLRLHRSTPAGAAASADLGRLWVRRGHRVGHRSGRHCRPGGRRIVGVLDVPAGMGGAAGSWRSTGSPPWPDHVCKGQEMVIPLGAGGLSVGAFLIALPQPGRLGRRPASPRWDGVRAAGWRGSVLEHHARRRPPADRRHHRVGQVGRHQHDDPVAALPADAGRMPVHHDRPEDAGTVGL